MLTYRTQVTSLELAEESCEPSLTLHPFAAIISKKSYGVVVNVYHAWSNQDTHVWDVEYTIPRGK